MFLFQVLLSFLVVKYGVVFLFLGGIGELYEKIGELYKIQINKKQQLKFKSSTRIKNYPPRLDDDNNNNN